MTAKFDENFVPCSLMRALELRKKMTTKCYENFVPCSLMRAIELRKKIIFMHTRHYNNILIFTAAQFIRRQLYICRIRYTGRLSQCIETSYVTYGTRNAVY